MRPFQILLLFFLAMPGLQSQPGPAELQKQVDELRSRIKILEKENTILKAGNRSEDSTVYCSIRSEIFEAFTNVPRLDFDFKSTADKIAVTGLFTKLMQANNPTSDILGFRFTEIIISASEKHFKEALKDEGDKKRFSQVISKIIDNPVVSSLAKTNPVTSVVATIISTVAGFTTSRVELDRESGKIRDVSLKQQDAFDNKNITAFRHELQVYIDFYDALINASWEYLDGLENLNAKYAYLIQSVNSYKTELYTELEIKEGNLLMTLSNLLPDPAWAGIDYHRIIHDPKIRKSLQLVKQYHVLHLAVSDFKKEYNTLLFSFLSKYIKTLKTAKDFPEENIDKAKTDLLISDIEIFISSQKNKELEELDAFL